MYPSLCDILGRIRTGSEMKIGIIGGGAAGLMASVCAAKQHAEVTVFEHMPRVGKKLLLTGSGKCNISNLNMDISHYHCDNMELLNAVINQDTINATYDVFRSIGVAFKDRNGYLYPYCEQSSAVVDALRFAADEAGISVMTDCEVTDVIKADDGRFILKYMELSENTERKETSNLKENSKHKESCRFDKIIIAAGSCAYAKTGSDGSGYKLAKALGHNVIEPYPALTYLKCNTKDILPIANIRTQARVSLSVGGQIAASECGELQITKNGLSGIPVFQISYKASKAFVDNKKVKLLVNFLPEVSFADRADKAFSVAKLMLGEPHEELLSEPDSRNRVIDELTGRISTMPDRKVCDILTGLLNRNIVMYLLQKAGIQHSKKASKMTESEISDMAELLICTPFDITGTGGFDEAQICAGGVDSMQIGNNMESKLVGGLYFAGEIVDAFGDCGGYNLQWAWSSAYIAGRNNDQIKRN